MDEKLLARALRAAADVLDAREEPDEQPAEPKSSRSPDQTFDATMRRLKEKHFYNPFNMLDINVQRSAKVPKLMLKDYLYKALEQGTLKQVDEDGHVWQFVEPWYPRAADGSSNENVYQILLRAVGRKPFDLDRAVAAFKDGTPERVLPEIRKLIADGNAIMIDDVGIWMLEK